MKRQEKEWLYVLRKIRHGNPEKIFTKEKGWIADISYELNGIMESAQSQILQLKKADESHKQILTSLSHDVRTPLTSLLGYLEALNHGIDDENEKQEYLAVAYRKANDLKSFIDMLFEWFKLNSNEYEFHFEPLDINEITREIIIEWLPKLEQENISFSAVIGDDDLKVMLDQTAYKRIINNLIQNAILHSKCTKILVCVKRTSHNVWIQIANNGQNIPAKQLPHIFERLYKGDSARSDKGSGLGLAITKELTRALCGEISVTSELGKDTIFTISLPNGL